MTTNYLNEREQNQRWRNKEELESQAVWDPDYVRFLEDRKNTMKMKTILKSLNSPRKRRRAAHSNR